jgi:hypothetical protein
MLIDDLPLGGPDEPVRTWLKDRRQMRQLVPWVLKRRDIYGEFAVAQRRVVITRRLAEWLLDELGIDPNRVDAYAKDPGFQGICRYSIEKGGRFRKVQRGMYAVEDPTEAEQSVRRVPRGDPSRAAEQGDPVTPREPPLLDWRTRVAGSGGHSVVAASWPHLRKAAVFDELVLERDRDAEALRRARELVTDPRLRFEIKVEYTNDRSVADREPVPHPGHVHTLVEVLFDSEAEARGFESPLLRKLKPFRVGANWFRISPTELEAVINEGLDWQGRPQLRPRNRDPGGDP